MALNVAFMFAGLLVLSCLRFQVSFAASRNCYKCASTDLKSKWYLTGYPIQLVSGTNENVYTGDCGSPRASLPTESCDGPCVAYMFEYISGTSKSNTMYVRGCYKTLTGDTGDKMVVNITKKQCVYEERNELDVEKNPVQIRRQIAFCGDTDKCNQDSSFKDGCDGLSSNRDSKTCVCNDAECKDKPTCTTQGYCYKKEIAINEGNSNFQQGCTDVNIYGYDTCKTTAGQSFIATRSVGADLEEIICYCESDNCNSASTFSGLFGLSFLSLITLLWKMSI